AGALGRRRSRRQPQGGRRPLRQRRSTGHPPDAERPLRHPAGGAGPLRARPVGVGRFGVAAVRRPLGGRAAVGPAGRRRRHRDRRGQAGRLRGGPTDGGVVADAPPAVTAAPDGPAPRRAWMSWSSGKDSAFALHEARASGEVDVVGLLTTVNEEADRVAMHGVRRSLLEAQAAALGLPLRVVALPWPCPNEVYRE